jgi:hypothetical protein
MGQFEGPISMSISLFRRRTSTFFEQSNRSSFSFFKKHLTFNPLLEKCNFWPNKLVYLIDILAILMFLERLRAFKNSVMLWTGRSWFTLYFELA